MEFEILVISLCVIANVTAYYWDLLKNHKESDD